MFALTILLSLSLTGCSQSDTEDHDEHLEHIIPAHKPQNFSECVVQLRLRGDQFFESDISETELTELNDIVKWIPELAADSDLKRQQWEMSQKIGSILKTVIQSPRSDTTRSTWQESISELEKLVPYAEDTLE